MIVYGGGKMQKIKISNGQILILLITLVASTAWLFLPAVTSKYAKQDAWISVLIPASIYGLAVVWVNSSLAQHFKGKTFGQYLKMLLGKPLAYLITS